MDIHTPIGSKVVVTEETMKAGREGDYKTDRNFLEVGKEYEVSAIEIFGYHTDVWVKEIPDTSFNSVRFKNVEGYEREKEHEMFKKVTE